MAKINRKQLNNVLRQARNNNYKKDNLVIEKNYEEILNIRNKTNKFKWNHKKGQLGYLKIEYSNHEINDILLVIGESYNGRVSKHNCFFVLINSKIEDIPGSYIRTY